MNKKLICTGWNETKDEHIRCEWACEDKSCEDYDKKVFVDPSFYQDNGTPRCSCGVDLTYKKTEVFTADGTTFGGLQIRRTEFPDSFPVQVYHGMTFSELIGEVTLGIHKRFKEALEDSDMTAEDIAKDDLYNGLQCLVEASKTYEWSFLPFDENGDFPVDECKELETVYCHCDNTF